MAEHTAPPTGRGIGPVTLATSGSVAAVTVLVWALRVFFGVEVPDEVAGAAAVLVALAAGYLTPSKGHRA
ncbi:hypothetical protein [Sinomonas sp. ASV322]|uniref:hypothetical protein n=1 Tax=Sinomonas sp. ASV322 TaxID=3041920 RepID=UPI0027DCD89B|nr:hypothetical protein [Sinomonas sp. ASV322]MDQ4502193.1 hypothetical protein [Sinomonas sp. ASV322]